MSFAQIILFIVCLPSFTPHASAVRLGTWLHSLPRLLLEQWLACGGAQSFSTEWLWLMSIHLSSVSFTFLVIQRKLLCLLLLCLCLTHSGGSVHRGPPKVLAPLSAVWGVGLASGKFRAAHRAGCPWAQPGTQSPLGRQARCNQNFLFVKRIWSEFLCEGP